MQAAMDRLGQFTRRHRVIVVVAWLALLVAAMPFAARQTEHLTSGGFEVPGSGSAAVDRGTVLAGVTDGFEGQAPDLGALELGAPLLVYGPRR